MINARPLGHSGYSTSALGFGAWAIGGLGYSDVPEEDALGAIEAYLDLGGRHIDTARGYGVSEIYIGKVLRRRGMGEEVFVASKSGSSIPAMIRCDLETSRFCLQRDCIDLYYIHVPPRDPDLLDRMLDVYQGLKGAGKIRLVGVSQPGEVNAETADLVHRYIADGRVDVIQLVYSMGRQRFAELFEAARQQGVGIVSRMALEGGLLAGRYKPGHIFPDNTNDWRAHRSREQLDSAFALGQDLAAQYVRPPYTTLAQVALRFCLDNPGISTVLAGGKTAAQVRENMVAAQAGALAPEVYQGLAERCGNLEAYLNGR